MSEQKIWRTSWGYDQTNVEYFEEVRETKVSIVLRRIATEVRDGRVYPLPGQYIVDWGLMGNSTVYDEATGTFVPSPTYQRDKARGYSEKMCRKPRSEQYPSVKITESRRAYPYTGGGAYDTIAAGQPGH